jgi:hypothetical protein
MDVLKILLVAAVGLAGAPAAIAGTWTGVYGNTITSTYSDGRVVRVFVEPDHTYSIVLPDGAKLTGTWADAVGQSCFTVTNPPPAPGARPSCFPLKEYKVGDSFSGEDASGKYVGVISAGR